MNNHKWINLILALFLLAATVAIPNSTTAAGGGNISLPASLQSIHGATASWRAVAQDDLQLPKQDSSREVFGMTDLTPEPDWTGFCDEAACVLGFSVAAAGDVNGDGYADIIAGAPGYNNGEVGEGAAFVYYNSAAGLPSVPSWAVQSNQAGAEFGYSVGTAGDVNGDGYDDVIVGAPYYHDGESNEGVAFVYLGSAIGLSLEPAWHGERNVENANFGISVASAGDVNCDGYDDVIAGAPGFYNGQVGEGYAALYHGSITGLSSVAAWSGESDQVSGAFGISVASAGDVNSDGCDDVIIGAYGFTNGEVGEGAAVVYLGSEDGLALIGVWRGEGNQEYARYGKSVGTAGDVNGDGYDDVVVGAHNYNNGQIDEGAAAVYLGSATGVSITPSWVGESHQENAYFGHSVASAGDVNGDGYDDVIIGVYKYDNGQADEGVAGVYLGSPTGLAFTGAWWAESNQESAHFGYAVASAGDINKDGLSDIIIGSPYYNQGEVAEGLVAIYHNPGIYLSFLPAILSSP